jgi:hypothetical protein
VARAIAVGLSHPFGVGNSHFRIGSSAPRWVDNVPFGCYRREVFDRIGLFDEDLVRNQDDELNLRLIRNGGRILLVPTIESTYHARDSLRKLWRMNYQYGYFKPLVIRKIGAVMTVRQIIPGTFVLSLITAALLAPFSWPFELLFVAIAAAYLGGCIVAALTSIRRCGARAALALLAVFPVIHFAYGTGFLRGIADFFLRARVTGANPSVTAITR